MERTKRLKKSPSEVISLIDEPEAYQSHDGKPQDSQPTGGNNAAAAESIREPFLQQWRHQAIAGSGVEYDQGIPVDQLMTMCEALVNSNREIWDRCKPFCCDHIKSDDASSGKCVFYRMSRLGVIVKCHNGPYGGVSPRGLTVEVKPYVAMCAIEIPICLPTRLGQLVVNPRPDKDEIMPDFGLVLRQSTLLIDNVVPMVLQEFKAFLESQQVALRKVEVLLFQGKDNDDQIFTLQDQDGNDLSWDNGGLCKNYFCKVVRGDDRYYEARTCIHCIREIEDHDVDTENGWFSCRTKNRKGCFWHPQGNATKLLLQCPFHGKLQFELDVETSEDRLRVIKFLEFLGHNKSKPVNLTQG